MSKTRSLVLLVTVFSLPAFAGDFPHSFATRYEGEIHLLSAEPASSLRFDHSLLQENLPEKKSPALAALYSLILPGMGELYADGFGSGKYFLVADGLLWLTFAAFEVSGNSLRDDSRAFAVSRAGVNTDGKDDQYFVDIGNFLDITEYNEKQLRDREPDKLYDPAAGYAWQWDSDASRATYRDQRISSETMYNNKKFVVAALIVNRVASAINAVRSAISFNNSVSEALGDLRFDAELMGSPEAPHGVLLTVTRRF